jgi:MFS family permease
MAGSTTLGLGLLPPIAVAILLGAGTILLAAYAMHGRRAAAHPLIDLTLLKIPTFRHSLTGGLLFRIGIGATPFLLPLLLQVGFQMTPFQSGLITFASAVGAIAMKFVAPPVLKRFGFRQVLMWNTFVTAAFVGLPALFTPATPAAVITGLLLIGGFFRSLQFTSINALAFADVPPQRMSKATTLTSVAQQLSLSLGISIGAIALEFTSAATGGAITAASFWPAFLLVALIALASLVPLSRLSDDAGDELSGRQSAVPDPVTVMRERA